MNVIEWLHTPEGEAWSERYHLGTEVEGGNPARYSHGIFASVKDDHECGAGCPSFSNSSFWVDNIIRKEIERYGMNGLPEAA